MILVKKQEMWIKEKMPVTSISLPPTFISYSSKGKFQQLSYKFSLFQFFFPVESKTSSIVFPTLSLPPTISFEFWLPLNHCMAFNPFQHNDTFWRPLETGLLKTLWEEKLFQTSNFSFSHCFLPVWITFCHFRQIWNCLQTLSIWKSLKFVVW